GTVGRAVEGERRDDEETARCNRGGGQVTVGRAVGRVGGEVENPAVGPQPVAPLRTPGEDVRDFPGDGRGARRLSGGDQAGAGAVQRMGGGGGGGREVGG